jgi:hypothetical protein
MADAIYNKVAEFMTDTVVFTPKASVDKYNKLLLALLTQMLRLLVASSMTQFEVEMYRELKLLILVVS